MALSGGGSKYPLSRCSRRSYGQAVSFSAANRAASSSHIQFMPATSAMASGQACPRAWPCGGGTIDGKSISFLSLLFRGWDYGAGGRTCIVAPSPGGELRRDAEPCCATSGAAELY